MHWQDMLISIGQYIFIIALLPSVLGEDKPALSSSIMTGAILTMFAITYFTLGFWSSTFSSGFLAGMWFYLGWQQYRKKYHNPDTR
jgi:uncharacterized membrane protein